jgi:hypothetical protein
MRRRKLLAAVAVLAVLVAAGAFVLWPRPNRITWENLYRIQKGMSQEQVEAILGPPGDYTTRPTISGVTFHGRATEPESPLYWAGDDLTVAVIFTSQDKTVTAICGWRVQGTDQTALDNLLWRIERRWQEWFAD